MKHGTRSFFASAFLVILTLGLAAQGQAVDTAFIQGIINANAGGTAMLPAGKYVVRGLTVGANTRVTSAGTTLLKLEPDGTPKSTDPILSIQGNSVTIDHVTFDGNRARQVPDFHGSWIGRADSPAILIDHPTSQLHGIQINDCTFKQTAGAAIAARDLSAFTVVRNVFQALSFEAVFLDHNPALHWASENVIISSNAGSNINTPANPAGAKTNAFLVNYVDKFAFVRNVADNIQRDLIKAQNVTNASISHNKLTNNSADNFAAIQVADVSSHVEISSNTLQNVQGGIYINGTGASHITIRGNLIENTTGGTGSFGILIGGTTSGPDIVIATNTLNNVDGVAIRVASGADGVAVSGNKVIRGTGVDYAQAFRFDVSARIAVTSLKVTKNCFLGYDGGTLNHGAVWFNTRAGGGSNVTIEDNLVQSASGKKTVDVGPSATPAVYV